jgi:hypothetical protein
MKEYYCPSCKEVVAVKPDGRCADCGSYAVEPIFSSASPAREMTGIDKVCSSSFGKEGAYETRLDREGEFSTAKRRAAQLVAERPRAHQN